MLIPRNHLAKEEAKEDSVDAMRDFANGSVRYNRQMSVVEKEFLGIGPRDTVPTNHPRPSSVPDTDARMTRNHFEHRGRALDALGRAASARRRGRTYLSPVSAGDRRLWFCTVRRTRGSRCSTLPATKTVRATRGRGRLLWKR
jgi:hypothetical protein